MAACELALPLLAAQSVPAGKPPRIRITNVESFQVEVPGGRFAVTRVHTDAGIIGTSFLPTQRELLERWVKPTLAGDDLFAVDRHLKRLQMEPGESGVQAWSGV